MKIRKAEVGDIPELETLFLVTRQCAFNWESPDKFKLEDFKKSTFGETIFVAEDDSSIIVGFISVWQQDTIPFIHHLFVAPNHQRRGIGKQLIERLFTYLPLPYRLKCMSKNKAASAFYHKHGWVEVGKGLSEDGEYLLLELPSVRSKHAM